MSGFTIVLEPTGLGNDVVIGPFDSRRSARRWAADNLGELRGGRVRITRYLTIEQAEARVEAFRKLLEDDG